MSAAGLSTPLAAKATRVSEVAGLALVVAGIAWWAVVYVEVINNTGFPLERTLPCLVYTSDRCSLAMSLCKQWHLLGIKRYSEEILWVGGAFCCLALVLGSIGPGAGQSRKKPPGA